MSRPFTILIPVHNEAENIAPLRAELERELGDAPHRVIVVDDGSTDGTPAELARHAPGWTVVSTPRVGKSRALELGLEKVDTDRVVMMDGDLQDDSSAIPALLASLDAGFDCAVGCRARRRDGWLVKRFPSFFFNLWISLLFGFRFLDINTGLKAFRTDSLRRIRWFENCHRFFPLLVFRAGGRVSHLPTNHRPRVAGLAKFNSPLRFLGGFSQALALRLGWMDPARSSARLARLAPVIAALLCGSTFFHWAAGDWYFADYDSAAFVPHMVRYAADGELINTYQPSARQWDPAGIGRQVGHGFLPSIVVGALSPEPTYRSVHLVIAFVSALGLLLFARLLLRLAPGDLRRPWPAAGLHALAVFATAYFLHTREGRPEVFVFLVVVIGLWSFLSFATLGRLVVSGLVLGLLALTSPVAALLVGLVFLGWLIAARPGGDLGRAFVVSALATLAALALGFAFYPYPIADWISGHLIHADITIVRPPPGNAWGWFYHPNSGWGGLILVVSTSVTLALLFARRDEIRHRAALALIVTLLMATAWYFGIRLGFSTYNLAWIPPFGLCIVLAAWSRLRAASRRNLAALALAALLAPSALAFTAEQIIRAERLRTGPSPDDVRALLAIAHPADDTRPALLSAHFFHLVGLDPRYQRVSKHFTNDRLPGAAFMLVSQADMRQATPPSRKGWRIYSHNFDHSPIAVAGLPLRGLNRGFHYALYLPEGAEPPPALSAFIAQPQATGSESKESNQ